MFAEEALSNIELAAQTSRPQDFGMIQGNARLIIEICSVVFVPPSFLQNTNKKRVDLDPIPDLMLTANTSSSNFTYLYVRRTTVVVR